LERNSFGTFWKISDLWKLHQLMFWWLLINFLLKTKYPKLTINGLCASNLSENERFYSFQFKIISRIFKLSFDPRWFSHFRFSEMLSVANRWRNVLKDLSFVDASCEAERRKIISEISILSKAPLAEFEELIYAEFEEVAKRLRLAISATKRDQANLQFRDTNQYSKLRVPPLQVVLDISNPRRLYRSYCCLWRIWLLFWTFSQQYWQ